MLVLFPFAVGIRLLLSSPMPVRLQPRPATKVETNANLLHSRDARIGSEHHRDTPDCEDSRQTRRLPLAWRTTFENFHRNGVGTGLVAIVSSGAHLQAPPSAWCTPTVGGWREGFEKENTAVILTEKINRW